MLTYEKMLERLKSFEDETYRAFHKKLLHNEAVNVIGVRMPILRKLAKEWAGEWREILAFPDEYYEVTLLKCLCVGKLPFREFCENVNRVVPLLDNWATCDCFDAPCIAKNRQAFVPYIRNFLADGREFVVRYGLVTLLHYYVEEEYLPLIFESVEGCGAEQYYVMMGAAWLVAEVLVKHFEAGVQFLGKGTLPKSTHNKAIQKARESFRLTAEQKARLNAMKR